MTGTLTFALWLSAMALGGSPPPMPDWDPALVDMVGTWENTREVDGKPLPLLLVIRERRGKLEIRYQLNSEDRVFTSDWSGRCEVKTRLDIKGRHRPSYTIDSKRARLLVDNKVKYSGSARSPELRFQGYYALDESKNHLSLHCESAKLGGKKVECTLPMVYERVSDGTEWPEDKD